MLRECCFVWNHALALQRRYYKLFGKYISVGKMQKHFSKRIKRNLLHSQTVQEILQRLDSAYNRFFKKLAKRPPKLKSPEKFNSFVFKQGGFTLNGNILTINKGKKRFKRFSNAKKGSNNRRRRLFELQQACATPIRVFYRPFDWTVIIVTVILSNVKSCSDHIILLF